MHKQVVALVGLWMVPHRTAPSNHAPTPCGCCWRCWRWLLWWDVMQGMCLAWCALLAVALGKPLLVVVCFVWLL